MCFIAINIFAAALFRFDSPIFHIKNNKNENSSEKLEALRKKKGAATSINNRRTRMCKYNFCLNGCQLPGVMLDSNLAEL